MQKKLILEQGQSMAVYGTLSDQELTALMREGDRLAYTELYHRYWPLLYRHARKMLQDQDDALDVVQDVFTSLWLKSAELEISMALSSYLYSAVRNAVLNFIKRSKLKNTYLDSLADFLEKGEFVTDEQVRYNEFAATIEAEINKLPPKMREIFILSRNLGLSYSQIAAQLNISDETVRKQMYRALKQLRLRLGPQLFTLIL
ncbi:RNA polymerase sigma factor [Pedobacter sp. GR22-6]|uniref:RNA polymerase sigma factor n=1 Tax=Pedobacter sp. GR22-6 TaxID=3127957 RepID=UPI00307E0E61